MSASLTDNRPFVQGTPKDLREVDDRPRTPTVSPEDRVRVLGLTVKFCGEKSADVARMLGLI